MLGVGLFVTAVRADDPPKGVIVIRPQGKAAPPGDVRPASAEIPDLPGFIMIRPQRGAGATSKLTRGPEPENYGKVTIIYPKADGSKPDAVPKPDARPAVPPPVRIAFPAPQAPAAADPPALPAADQGKLLLDAWDAVFVKDMHVGFVHTAVREFERDGKTFLYGTKEHRLTVKRFDQKVELWEKESTLETPEGQVLVVRRQQGVGPQQALSVVGQVSGKTLTVKGEGAAAGAGQSVPFPEGVLGVCKEATLMKDKKPKPGETIDYQYYAGQVNWVAKFTVTAKAVEEQTLYIGDKPRKLLKVEVKMDPIRDQQGGVFELPTATVWCDAASFDPLKTEFDNPTLGGTMVVLRTTKEAASRPPTKVPDLFSVQSIPLDRSVDGIHQKAAVTYRVTLAGDADPKTAFVTDARQVVRNVAGKSFELAVTAVRRAADAPAEPPADEKVKAYVAECLGTSFYIDWDNAATKRHAAAAVANLPATATAWDKARAVEKWVRANMKPATFDNSMDPTSKVAETLSGDCTEFSVLAAGMCRALGIPSRTALGLVYAPDRDTGKPYLAYHMWFEVFVDDRWVALDGTLGLGSVGPGHLKITTATWHNERSMAPLLPVMRLLMARPTVTVAAVK
jgi:hypothetical protein